LSRSRSFSERDAVRALRLDEVAWIALLPCAALLLAAIVVLGPPIGHGLMAPGPGEVLWPRHVLYVFGQPEPVKRARFAIAMLGPPLLVAILLASGRRPLRLRDRPARALVAAAQALTLVALVAAVLAQWGILARREVQTARLFGPLAVPVALLVAAALVALPRRARIAALAARLARDTRRRRIACVALAAAFAATWLLLAVDTEGSVGLAKFQDLPPWSMGDTFAVLDGRTPLVDFYPLYGGVWAYVAAVPMAVFGPTVTTFTVVMTSISAAALLALYATLRRVVGSPIGALLLYLPIVSAGFLTVEHGGRTPGSNVEIFSVWPLRYAGPCLLAWLTARHLDGARPRGAWWLFLVGGLVAVNNLEFGIGAVAGTTVALLCARRPRGLRALAGPAASAAGGLLAALAAIAALTLVRSGRLPDFGYLSEYPRIFGVVGAASLSMPTLGPHLALYATFAATLTVAAARLAGGAEDRLLTSMLAWSGTFGLFAGSYFAGRSDSLKLTSLLAAWGLALALLLVHVLRSLRARGWARPGLAELLVLAGFGLAACSLVQLPAPWSQIARLGRTTPTPAYAEAGAERLVASTTRRGEKVALLVPMGHRIAYDAGVADVSPYAFVEAMLTRWQWRNLLAAMRREHARKLYLPDALIVPEQIAVLERAGLSRRAGVGECSEWTSNVDVRPS